MVVVDASVIVALHRRSEIGHAVSYAWYRESTRAGVVLAAPTILLTEVAAAVSRDPGMTTQAIAVMDLIEQDGEIQLHPLTSRLAHAAGRFAAELGIRGCDSVYMALAKQLGAPLVTLDEQQLKRGPEAVETRRPGE